MIAEPKSEDVLEQAKGIDLIGDVHGHYEALCRAFTALGYQEKSGVWAHPTGRKALFIGDLVDRGAHNRRTVNAVRQMVKNGEAICLMGNHEFNAVMFATPDSQKPDEWLRPRSAKNRRQHSAFLDEYDGGGEDHEEYQRDINWFKGLPLWIDLGDLRAVHACWSQKSLNHLSGVTSEGRRLDEDAWIDASQEGHPTFDAIEVALKGFEVALPNGISFLDKDKNERRHARVKWWKGEGAPWSDIAMGPPELTEQLNAVSGSPELGGEFPIVDRPTFFGHYWFKLENGEPYLAASPNACCLDFSVAGGGAVGVYRWDGEVELDAGKLLAFK